MLSFFLSANCQIRELSDEEVLQDVVVSFGWAPWFQLRASDGQLVLQRQWFIEYLLRSSSTTFQTSSFLLCLASPVVFKMLCGNFSESKRKKLKIDDVDGRAFIWALDVWCGRKDWQEVELGEVPLLVSVADRFQMTEVTSVLEEALLRQLRKWLQSNSRSLQRL
jgi:hypothetical protein